MLSDYGDGAEVGVRGLGEVDHRAVALVFAEEGMLLIDYQASFLHTGVGVDEFAEVVGVDGDAGDAFGNQEVLPLGGGSGLEYRC